MDKSVWPPKAFCEALQHNLPISKWVRNVETQLHWERLGETMVPITRNQTELESSYVVSPYSALILYSRQEMKKLPSYLRILETILAPLSLLLKVMKLNQAVSVNNWLLSTNLYPKAGAEQFAELASKSIAASPNSFVIFRSLNFFTYADLILTFKSLGFSLIPSRQVYFFDFRKEQASEFRNLNRDLKFLSRTSLQIIDGDDFSDLDFDRAEQLYNFLYLEKYSIYNPAFSNIYLKLCRDTKIMRFLGMRDSEGVLQGVVGFFIVDGVMTVPIVGYDIHRPQKEGLYRLLIAIALKYARDEKLLVNLSSGASSFKIFRGGQPVIEYSAVYIKHLKWYRRLGFRIIQFLLFSLALPILKIFKL